MNNDNSLERLPIVDESGNVIGSATRGECHSGAKLLHPVVHLHVFDAEGRLFLQKRPIWKDIQPGKWDTAVGGHVDFEESVLDALLREAREELSIQSFSPIFLKRYIFESDREKELINAYSTVIDAPIIPTEELDGGRFWTPKEIEGSIGKKIFTPNFESEYIMLFGKSK